MDIHSKLPTLIRDTVHCHDFFVDATFRNDLIQFPICFVWETPRRVALCIIAGVYRVIHKSMKHFKNSQQIDYATDHGNSYVDGERNCLSFFKEKPAQIVALICR